MLHYIVDRYFIKQPRLRRWVTSLLYPDKDLDIELCGVSLRINARRENGYYRAARASKWMSAFRDEMAVIQNLASIIRNQDTFVDIGANVGLYTHGLKRLRNIYPQFSVVAFEPHPSTFQRLAFTSQPGITYHNVAIGAEEGVLQFVDGAVSHVFTSVKNANSYNIQGETVDVPIRRLDGFDWQPGSLILKIDVEGQEYDVLLGAEKLLQQKRVQAVYVDGYSDNRLLDLLRDLGFHALCGRTLLPYQANSFALLAVQPDRLQAIQQ